MNAARLARLLQEAGEDRRRWAEVLYDEITDPSTGLVTKDHLDKRFAEFQKEFSEFKAEMTRWLLFTQASGFVALAILILLK